MLFTSPTFLMFLLIVLVLHALLRGERARRVLLLLASYAFYSAWDFPNGLYFAPLLLASTLIDYWTGLRLYLTPRSRAGTRKALLLLSLTANLGVLAIFKYLGFFARTLNDLAALAGSGEVTAVPRILLPLGISFFTFQTMSYTIDAYRRKGRPYRKPLDFALFVAFFPQLVAGPIVRASQFRYELNKHRDTGWRALDEGLRIALVGLLLKVVLADNVAPHVDRMFAEPGALTPLDALAAVYGFTLQIFCDFAGYSLIAIGLARCFGFRMPENFRAPYLATNIRDFWRRWHMTLSTWLRDYLYIPLGGSRHGAVRTTFALALTMLLGGLWHGASWNFVLWGAAHGLLLAIGRLHRAWASASAAWWDNSGAGKALGWLLTFHVVALLWVPFRAATLADTFEVLRLLTQVPAALMSGGDAHYQAYAILPFFAAFASYHLMALWKRPEVWATGLRPAAAVAFYVAGVLAVEVFYIGEVSFIYFAF